MTTYYAVFKGNDRGVYTAKEAFEQAINGYDNPEWKTFQNLEQATEFADQGNVSDEGKHEIVQKINKNPGKL